MEVESEELSLIMNENVNKSSTMRIDLIPDISDIPLSEKPKASFVMPVGGEARKFSPTPQNDQKPGGYGELFQDLYDAGIVTDLYGRVRDVNRRALDFFGYSPEQFSHLTIDEIIAGADDELIRTLYENLQNECFTLMQAFCYRSDGTAFPAEVSVSQLRLSTPHLCFFVRDETMRRQADEMLRTEHNALQNASDAIVVIDMNSQIEYANPATARIWGYPSTTDLVGQPLGKLLLNENDGVAVLESLSGERFMTSGVAVALRYDDEPFRVNVRAASNRDSDGNVVGAVLSFSDLTERDKAQTAERDVVRFRDTIKRMSEFRNVLKCGVEEVSTLLRDLAYAKTDANEQVQKRLLESVEACAGIEAVLEDMHELLEISIDQNDAKQPLSAND